MEFDKKKEDKVMKSSSPSSKNCKKKLDPMNKGKEVEDNDDSIRKLDQEFIVFSFREDGTFDVAVESNSPKSESFTSVDGKHVNSNRMIRKVHIIQSINHRLQIQSTDPMQLHIS